jgi:hypothetical protein
VSEEIAVPNRGALHRQRDPGAVDHSRTPGAGAPVHRPGELSFQDAVGIDEAWSRLSRAVQERAGRDAGRILGRWAWVNGTGEVSAILLGTHALVRATPARSSSGRPAHVVETVRLRPSTARSAAVHEDTAGRRREQYGVAGGGAAVPIILPDTGMAEFLGHLPAQAQQLLQDPFLGTGTAPRGEYHYLQTTSGQGFGRRTLQVFCYLFDAQWLTCVSGEAVTYGHTFDAADWELTCRRMAVLPK